jgi:hypothetical protein
MSSVETVQPEAKLPQVHASLSIIGEFSVEEATRIIGLEPSWVLRKGVPRDGDSRRASRYDCWTLRTKDSRTMDGDGQLRSLVKLVDGYADAIRTFCAGRDARPQVGLYATVPQGPFMAVPNLQLDAEFIAWLTSLGATFAIDYSIHPPGD